MRLFILFLKRKQLELYTELIKDYDLKTKELTIENTDLKSFLALVYSNLHKTAKSNQADSNDSVLLSEAN